MHHAIECGCGHHGQHDYGRGMHHYGTCCCAHGHTHRRFFTREETITHWEEYLTQLKAEVKGLEEHINHLRKGEA